MEGYKGRCGGLFLNNISTVCEQRCMKSYELFDPFRQAHVGAEVSISEKLTPGWRFCQQIIAGVQGGDILVFLSIYWQENNKAAICSRPGYAWGVPG